MSNIDFNMNNIDIDWSNVHTDGPFFIMKNTKNSPINGSALLFPQ